MEHNILLELFKGINFLVPKKTSEEKGHANKRAEEASRKLFDFCVLGQNGFWLVIYRTHQYGSHATNNANKHFRSFR